jgi:hypothetical protein
MTGVLPIVIILLIVPFPAYADEASLQARWTYEIVDTGVIEFYGNSSIIPKPKPDEPFSLPFELSHVPFSLSL